MSNPEIIPCPFCGSKALLGDTGPRLVNGLFSIPKVPAEWSFCVICTTCGGRGPVSGSAEDAIAGWNRRAIIASQGGDGAQEGLAGSDGKTQ